MSVPFQRVSNATISDIILYCPSAVASAEERGINLVSFFTQSSQSILYWMEFTWWKRYIKEVMWLDGITPVTIDPNGNVVTGFDPNKLIKSDQNLIKADVYGACIEYYRTIIADRVNVNEVDRENLSLLAGLYQETIDLLDSLANFYDQDGDGTVGYYQQKQGDPAEIGGYRRFW